MTRMLLCIILFFNFAKIHDACPPEYHIIDFRHSFCSHPFPGVIDQPVDSSQREHILYLHNHERRLVRGINMQKIYWNGGLAEIALRYARKCEFEHDKARQRSAPKIPLSTGQNLAMGYGNWTEAIGGWIDEKQGYHYARPATGIVAHYTQMIWHSTVLVGCAATLCPPHGPYNLAWPFYVCNYVTGQLNHNYFMPYEQGVDDHSLHDCQGKVCLYNGTLDLKTCQCQCPTYASGVQCERLNCSILPPCLYHSTDSCFAVNVPLECPKLCGLCERYEMLKIVYGDDNLAPDTPAVAHTITTTISSSTSTHLPIKKPIFRKLKKKFRKIVTKKNSTITTKQKVNRTNQSRIVTTTTLINKSFTYVPSSTLWICLYIISLRILF